MRWFEPRQATPDLREVLACRYVARSAGHHDLLPDGAMDLVWIAGGGVVLCGPDTRAWSFDMVPGRAMAGVRFRPGAAGAVFRVPAAELVDRRVPLADVLGAATERRLVDRLEATHRPDAIEHLVRRHLRAVDPVTELAARVAGDGRCSATVLADVSGLSTRQLRRRFEQAVGYGPAFYARVARLQRFATLALRRPERGLAELAAGAGYSDQSHLGRDTREIARCTPTELTATLVGSSVDVRSVPDGSPAMPRRWAA